MQKLVEKSSGTESDLAMRNQEFAPRHENEEEMKIIF